MQFIHRPTPTHTPDSPRGTEDTSVLNYLLCVEGKIWQSDSVCPHNCCVILHFMKDLDSNFKSG